MPATFVRSSVFWRQHQLDVSLPATRPIIDFLDDVVELIRTRSQDPEFAAKAEAESHLWVLSTPEHGGLAPERTLADYDILDGDRLYLTHRIEAAHEPFVDDVMAEMRHTVGAAQLPWSGVHRQDGLLATIMGLGAVTLGVLGLETMRHPAGVAAPAALAVLAVIGLALWRPRRWVRWVGSAIPLASALVAGSYLHRGVGEHALDAPVAWAGWVAIVALTFMPAAWLASRPDRGSGAQPARAGAVAAYVACGIVALVSAVCAVSVNAGASVLALAAWGAWVPIALLLATSTLAITSTGLSAMLRRNDEGAPIERSLIQARARRTEEVSRGIAWAATVLGALIVATLSTGPYWQQGLIAAALSVLLILRTSGFSDARVIVPLLLAGVGGLAWVSASMVRWFAPAAEGPWAAAAAGGVLALACLLMAFLVGHEPDALAEARVTKVLNFVDTVASLAFIPIVVAGQGVFTYYWATT